MKFQEVPGREAIKQRLIQAVDAGRIPHAQLFVGPQGSGQLALALAFLSYVYCQNKNGTDSCGECKPCKQIRGLQHPDVHFSYPVAKTEKSSDKPVSEEFLDSWRQFTANQVFGSYFDWLVALGIEKKQALISVQESSKILQNLALKSYAGGYRTQVIWMPERLHNSAANKLLKSLEEPEPGTLFLLVAQDIEQLLPTIVSRLQVVQLPPYTRQEVTAHLQTAFPDKKEQASLLAITAAGDLGYAEELARGESDHAQYAQWFVEWMRLCYKASIPELITWSEKISALVREQQKDFLSFCQVSLREAWSENFIAKAESHAAFAATNFSFRDFAPFLPTENMTAMVEQLNEAAYEIERNVNAKFVFLDTSFQFTRLIRQAARSKSAKSS